VRERFKKKTREEERKKLAPPSSTAAAERFDAAFAPRVPFLFRSSNYHWA
jgi:hypothetical protein